MVVPRADGKLGMAGHCWQKSPRSRGNGYGGTTRQFRPLDGKALRKNHHQYGASLYWIHHGGFHREKTGAARHAGGVFGAAAKTVKKNSENGGLLFLFFSKGTTPPSLFLYLLLLNPLPLETSQNPPPLQGFSLNPRPP